MLLHAIDAVRAVRTELPEVLTGVGTVLDAESARLAILAGAEFLVTPTVRPEVIAMGQRYGVPTFCGALTPSEILTAWELGAACVKVFAEFARVVREARENPSSSGSGRPLSD